MYAIIVLWTNALVYPCLVLKQNVEVESVYEYMKMLQLIKVYSRETSDFSPLFLIS
jgi:hypothetical protein